MVTYTVGMVMLFVTAGSEKSQTCKSQAQQACTLDGDVVDDGFTPVSKHALLGQCIN